MRNGKTIHGFKIYRYLANQVGLFSQVSGRVKNLIIGDDVKIVGLNAVGGISGYVTIGAAFTNCVNNASVFATGIALILMVVVQCVVLGANAGSFAGLFQKLGQSWLNILRNNTYTGVFALDMWL